MSLLDALRDVTRTPGVDVGEVVEIRGDFYRVKTGRGYILAKVALGVASVGEWVTYARAGGEIHILGKTRRPMAAIKTVRL
jgi:hypothetical protein